jgi:hypothetical protein
MRIRTMVVVLSVCLWTTWATLSAHAILVVTNHYDMEGPDIGSTSTFGGAITEPGWTHMQQSTAYTATSPGFHLGGVSQFTFNGIYRGGSTQNPTNVTADLILGGGAGSLTVPTIVFRDIVPAHSTNVSFTIYRSDPGDSFSPRFETRVRYNEGTEILVDPGSDTGGTYHPPITFNLALNPYTNAVALDFYFYTWVGQNGASTRLNGIEAIYTIPEPSSALLLALGGLAILVRRWRRS